MDFSEEKSISQPLVRNGFFGGKVHFIAAKFGEKWIFLRKCPFSLELLMFRLRCKTNVCVCVCVCVSENILIFLYCFVNHSES
mgnify:CR=1 FL=1